MPKVHIKIDSESFMTGTRDGRRDFSRSVQKCYVPLKSIYGSKKKFKIKSRIFTIRPRRIKRIHHNSLHNYLRRVRRKYCYDSQTYPYIYIYTYTLSVFIIRRICEGADPFPRGTRTLYVCVIVLYCALAPLIMYVVYSPIISNGLFPFIVNAL